MAPTPLHRRAAARRPSRIVRTLGQRLSRPVPATAAALVALLALGAGAQAGFGGSPTSGGIVRWAGADRFATAAAAAAATFPNGAPIAYVATGLDFPDALAAAAAAGGKGPVLLALPDSVPPSTGAELHQLDPSRVVVVGGLEAISATTLTSIQSFAPRAIVSRVDGVDRFATAAALAAEAFPLGAQTAYVATGLDFPDALSAAAAAGGKGPVLLALPDSLPPSTGTELQRLDPSRVVIVGGLSAVSSATKAAIEGLLPSADVLRASGDDRFATAANLSSYVFARGASIAYVVTGLDFPDALSAAAAAAGHGPVLLSLPDQAPQATVNELQRLGVAKIVVVGGTSAVSDAVLQGLAPLADGDAASEAPVSSSASASASSASFSSSASSASSAPIATPPAPSSVAAIAVQTAEAQVGKPYEFGGAGPSSFDCSGLTMYAWAAAGVQLPHNAATQASMVVPVTPDLGHLAPGDLLFYDSPIDHVTIYIGDGKMVEAPHTGTTVWVTTFQRPDLVGAGRPEPTS